MPQNIKKLFAFDFDDTLAITNSIIGVQRINSNNESDPQFMDWIIDNNLDFEAVDDRETSSEVVWFSSEDFAKYEEKARKDLNFLTANELEDKFDFSKTASIDLDTVSPIDNVLSIAKSAQGMPGSMLVIITARSGTSNLQSLAGKNITPTNQKDIAQFLSDQGLSISSSDINTAGDSGGGPGAKAKIMRSYIDQYNPEEVYFYDDSSGNVNAIADLCKDYFPHVKIKTFIVGEGGSVSLARECF